MYSRFKEYSVSAQASGPVRLSLGAQAEAGMERWRGRVALVTGASAGIGRAIAVELLRRGVHVVGCARRAAALDSVRDALGKDEAAGRFLPLACDVSSEEDILAMFERIKEEAGFAGVDICVNSAGCGDFDKFEDGKTESWRRMLMVNVLGLSICTREAIKSMRDRGVDDGHVIHVGSLVGHEVLHQIGTVYCATKFAVTALTEALRQELAAAKSKIRVTQLSPGLVATDFAATAAGEEFSQQVFAAMHALRPVDVAAQALFVLAAPSHEQVHDVILTANGPADA